MVVKKFTNGDIYDGDWENGTKHGQGTYTYAQGGSYEGEWKDDMRSGYGVNTWPNGDRYAGNWANNKRCGKGKFTYADGGRYNGQWDDDMRSGHGVNIWANGNQYDGSWENNQQHGQGTFTYADGGTYIGEWENNMRHGKGTNKWPNGDRYEGFWQSNRKHGKGTLYHKDGTKEEGNWTDDELNRALATGQGKGGNGKNKIDFKGVWINGQPFLIILMSKASGCSYQALAREFAASLNWDKAFFDDSNDRCYCSRCYKDSWNDVIPAGDSKYVIPRGWVRLGLVVDPVTAKKHDIWNKWIVTYHGTSKVAAESIITHRHFCMPGDVLIDGTKLAIRPGHIPGQIYIYTSPTIAYSSSPVYSPVYNFHSTENNSNYEAQIVLHCRQMPTTFQIGPETIGAKEQICPHVPNSQMEYYTDRRATLVAYGLLVRFRPKNG
jgi:hypothetical protein